MSDYEFILDGIVWSYSNLKKFEDCPYSWYKKYILNEQGDDKNIYSEFGSFCHLLLEKYLKGDIQRKTLVEKYENDFFDNVQSLFIGKNDPTEKLYDYGYDYFENINLDLSSLKPIGVEETIVFPLDKYKFKGILDLLYEDKNNNLVILDHKTSEYPLTKKGEIKKSKEKIMKGYTRQLALYAIGVEIVYNRMPRYIGWNFIRENKTYIIPVTKEILDEAREWALGIIKTIYETNDFIKNEQYIMCNLLCEYRKNCQG